MCCIYKLGMVAAVEHADDELHQLGVKTRVYLVNQQELRTRGRDTVQSANIFF